MNSVAALTELTPAQRRELLKMARARDLVRDRSELPPVAPAPRQGRPPLLFAQERLWFIDRLEPGSAVYDIPGALRLGALWTGRRWSARWATSCGVTRRRGVQAACRRGGAAANSTFRRDRSIRAALLRLGAGDHVLCAAGSGPGEGRR